MFNRRFTNKYFTKIEKTVKRITERDWMVYISLKNRKKSSTNAIKQTHDM